MEMVAGYSSWHAGVAARRWQCDDQPADALRGVPRLDAGVLAAPRRRPRGPPGGGRSVGPLGVEQAADRFGGEQRRVAAEDEDGVAAPLQGAQPDRRGIARSALLVLHGRDDPICPAWISEAFAGAVPQGQFRIYDGMRHEIFNEPENEVVFQDVLGWMREQNDGA